MIADLFFYSDVYGGNMRIPAEEFELWEKRAETELSQITGGRSGKSDEKSVKMCVCEIAELLYRENAREGIYSENNDGYSVRYNLGDIKKKIYLIAKTYLAGTDLLYRGV